MSQNPNNRNSLLLCFQEIIKMMPQAGDLNAFLSALEGVEDPLELCLKLANKLRLAPESRGDVTIEELASFFGAPIFLQLNNGNWCCISASASFCRAASSRNATPCSIR